MSVTDLASWVAVIEQQFAAVPRQNLIGLPPNFEFKAEQFSTVVFTKLVITVIDAAVVAYS